MDRRFLPEPKPRCDRCQNLSSQGYEEPRPPTKITLDAFYAASHRAVREMKEIGELSRRVKVRLNNWSNRTTAESNKQIRPMLGFKRFDNAAITISGIELAEKITKRQFKTGKLGIRTSIMSELWNATLTA